MKLLALVACALLVGCSDLREGQDLPGADTLTRAQRDSILGASKLPGHGAIQRGIDVADSASGRARQLEELDTLP